MYGKIDWKRATDIFGRPEVFTKGIDPNDVKQGALGDCYYLACLSSLAENPANVSARFVTKEFNQAGIYLMTLFVNGVVTPVVVDDYLPTL